MAPRLARKEQLRYTTSRGTRKPHISSLGTALHISMRLLHATSSPKDCWRDYVKPQQQRKARRGGRALAKLTIVFEATFPPAPKGIVRADHAAGMPSYLFMLWRVIEHGRERWRRLAFRDVQEMLRGKEKHLKISRRAGTVFSKKLVAFYGMSCSPWKLRDSVRFFFFKLLLFDVQDVKCAIRLDVSTTLTS